jgi:Chaperone of endosialidase
MSDKQQYEPPALTILGSVEEITAGKTGPEPDAAGGSFLPVSDRAVKDAIEPVDPKRVLEGVDKLDVSRWSYRWDDPSVRHIGPMSQDFAAAFDVGEDNRRIHPIDMNGVALAAIKALKAEVEELRTEVERLRNG